MCNHSKIFICVLVFEICIFEDFYLFTLGVQVVSVVMSSAHDATSSKLHFTEPSSSHRCMIFESFGFALTKYVLVVSS